MEQKKLPSDSDQELMDLVKSEGLDVPLVSDPVVNNFLQYTNIRPGEHKNYKTTLYTKFATWNTDYHISPRGLFMILKEIFKTDTRYVYTNFKLPQDEARYRLKRKDGKGKHILRFFEFFKIKEEGEYIVQARTLYELYRVWLYSGSPTIRLQYREFVHFAKEHLTYNQANKSVKLKFKINIDVQEILKKYETEKRKISQSGT